MDIERCPLTGLPIKLAQPDPNRLAFAYETPRTKVVKFIDIVYLAVRQLPEEEKTILGGIARNNAENNVPPVEFTASFLNYIKSQPIPYSFEDRTRHFLRYLYEYGGKEYKAVEGKWEW